MGLAKTSKILVIYLDIYLQVKAILRQLSNLNLLNQSTSMIPKKININQDTKQILEELIGNKIYLRNSFDQNQLEIQALVEQGYKNSLAYLERNRLGQKLAMFDENRLFGAITELGKLLQMPKIPRRIECYDISHLQGKFVYGSMVVFIDGRAVSKYYRIFKCKDQNDDFANHRDVMSRRLQRGKDFETSLQDNLPTDKAWQLPDLIIVDGGKGQLSSDYEVLKEFGLESKVSMVSLAKAQEEIFAPDMTIFQNSSDTNQEYCFGLQGGLLLFGEVKFLVQRIRDEAHRFAITSNRKARLKTIQKSSLDDMFGIGEKTKTKILQDFGSTQNLIQNLFDNPDLVHEKLGNKVFQTLKAKFTL
jgi:excinuclease ABC subunit C